MISRIIETPKMQSTSYIDRRYSTLAWGHDNAYPHKLIELIEGSKTAKACVRTFVRHVVGEGFTDESLNDAPINRRNQTLLDLLRRISEDYIKLGTFVLHVNYNLLGEIVDIYRVDPRNMRLGLKDSEEYIGRNMFWENWTYNNLTQQERTSPISISTFSPQHIESLIASEEGISGFNGHILWYLGDKMYEYPLSPFHAVLKALDTESAIYDADNRALRKDFRAKQILRLPLDAVDEKDAHSKELESFQGVDGKDIFTYYSNDRADLEEVRHSRDVDELREMNERTERAIITAVNQNPILHGRNKDNGLSSSDQIQNAFEMYNLMVRDDRNVILRELQKLTKYFYRPIPELETIPLTWINTSSQ